MKKTKSIWGNPPKRLYKLINLAEQSFDNNFSSCIVGCSDGKFLMPFARKGHLVVGYDIDNIAMFGGEKDFPIRNDNHKYKYSNDFVSINYPLEKRKVAGLKERLDIEHLSHKAKIELLDFYKNTPNEKFDVVFTSCSLHYSVNSCFNLQEKIEKLQSIVNINGYLYIDYMMAIEENDYSKYPKEKFFRKGEILNYFEDNWEIIHLKENNFSSFEAAHVDCTIDHFHRFGYILARRLK